MATIILKGMLFKNSISLILKSNKSFFVAFFKSSEHFMVVLFLLITFELILDGFLRFWTNPEIQDGRPRWPPFRNDDDVKGDIFRHTIYPPSLVVIAFIFSELRRGRLMSV